MEAFDQVYKDNAERVYKYLLYSTGDAYQAEELLQETFFQVLRSLHRYRCEASTSTWVFGIAKNVFGKHLRRNRRQLSLLQRLFAQPLQETPSPEAELLASPEHSRLYQAIKKLEQPYREVVILRGISGLSFREIGELMGQSETWARVTFYRGKNQARQVLEKGGEAGEGQMPDCP